MADAAALLADLERATVVFDEADAAREAARKEVVRLAIEALKAGAEPGDVYRRAPFTPTQMRTLAREAGIPPGRPGIKRRPKPAHDATESG